MKIEYNRFKELTGRYKDLRIAVVGDFCLDRYLEIDPELKETSLETGLEVYNVVKVRAQPGGAGTILNNLVALGIGKIIPIGFCGIDGEGYELYNSLLSLKNVDLSYFIRTPLRRTFTYCKPLIVSENRPPEELNRLDFKNWTPTPESVEDKIIEFISETFKISDAAAVLEQVDVADTGVITERVLNSLGKFSLQNPNFPIIADSRRGLKNFPPLIYKMNINELYKLVGREIRSDIEEIGKAARELTKKTGNMIFVTMGERGMIGATASGETQYQPALPPKGEIDIVGAGDAVTANLISALAAGATLAESIQIATAAAFIVIHKLGTTGTASIEEIASVLF
ncbi:MAG: bifunctional heptose 7-phosphate kinase/heptose 1-phosphate adenyltransferase [Verrucomicrobiia bacterium]